MEMTLRIMPPLDDRLRHAAEIEGMPAERFVLRVLEAQFRSEGDDAGSPELAPARETGGSDAFHSADNRRDAVVAMLRRWREADDAAEQRETGEYLTRALDEDRLSFRKLYP